MRVVGDPFTHNSCTFLAAADPVGSR